MVSSSPIETDEVLADVSDVAEEPVQLIADDSASADGEPEATGEDEKSPAVNGQDNEKSDSSVIDEQDVAMPYQEKSLEPDSDVVPMSPEDMERHLGIEIPLCAQYPDNRNPLHLR